LSEQCGKIIRDVEASGCLQIKTKEGDDSPVTIADVKVQKTIEVNLAAIYPTLTVEGEEAKETTQNLDSVVDPKDTERFKNFVTQDFLNSKQESREDFLK